MKRYIRSDYNKDTQFNTFEISNSSIRSIFSSHIYVGDKSERELIAEDVFEFLQTAYDEIGGFKSFKDIRKFIDDSYLWYITYDGQQPKSLEDFDIDKVLVVSVFRNRHGLKMVGMARKLIIPGTGTKSTNVPKKRNISAAIKDHIQFTCRRGWAEVSGKLEDAFQMSVGYDYIIDPDELKIHKIFSNMEIALDGLHYKRPLYKGEEPTMKIAYGTIKF